MRGVVGTWGSCSASGGEYLLRAAPVAGEGQRVRREAAPMVTDSRSVAREAWWLLSVGLAAGAAGCGGDTGPTTPPVPAQLAFTVQPTNTTIEATISPAVQVEIQDAAGARVAGERETENPAIGTNKNRGTLFGTTTENTEQGLGTL